MAGASRRGSEGKALARRRGRRGCGRGRHPRTNEIAGVARAHAARRADGMTEGVTQEPELAAMMAAAGLCQMPDRLRTPWLFPVAGELRASSGPESSPCPEASACPVENAVGRP